jgi:glucosyl-3-phosphoglycerate synthase
MVVVPGSIINYHHDDFSAAQLAERKGPQRISVVIPARDEERTVGRVVSAVRDGLVDRIGLVDDVVVVDDGSQDRTADMAAHAGARVVPSAAARDAHGRPVGLGKGEAMRTGLAATEGDIVVFLDADVSNLRAHFVTGLLGPLLTNASTVLVKGRFGRPARGDVAGGGRVTELVARPALALLFPDLSEVEQPIAGETALRREALAHLELDGGYGVDLGMLIDVAGRYGADALAQVDLGVRVHRSRPLDQLVPQAHAVLGAALRRAGVLSQS